MTYTERIDHIYKMLNYDNGELHIRLAQYGWGLVLKGFNDGSCRQKLIFDEDLELCLDWAPNQLLINDAAEQQVFEDLAYQVYLIKKAEFAKPLRNSKGQFTTNKR